ncbi:major facilitator superfamily domain-containing protein [Kockovaella imperatae]|uniref:Major facilitator superfamily domain-containing protein n=1 Tax=Kockovaella imperatae TaxID=4999 RepID=A0A1Y1URA0_9TREE|nr:major facilitator superfamily domain-containing protein [Kockovaella imperatae]ORX40117.1 major facilitator superfamily domain-containing protein [Kockovaella imperatae]
MSSSDPKTREWENDVVGWDSPEDTSNPMNWPKGKKIRTTLLLGVNTMCATFASSIFSASSPYIARQFHIGDEVALLGLSLYLLGFAIGPIIFGPSSELFGRRPTIILPMFIFACFSAATATASNLQTIFITRFFGGVMSSSPVTIVGGALADFWSQRDRGSAIVIYSLCIVGGPTLAPVIGAAISESYLTWRWTEYLCVILTMTVVCLDVLFLPETSSAILLSNKAKRLRLETGRWALHAKAEEVDHSLSTFVHKTLSLPLQMLAKEPMVLLVTTYNGFSYGILYGLFAAIPIIFEENRGWDPVPAALPNLATLVGTILAAAINMGYAKIIFARYMDTHGGKAPPEKRLPPMMIGSVCFPIGFFIMGWTSYPRINFFPSLIGLTVVGMSFLLIFQSGINYLIDGYTKNAVSAIAANTFQRSLFGAAIPLVTRPMFHNLGIQWACTLLGCIAALLGGIPFLFERYGQR